MPWELLSSATRQGARDGDKAGEKVGGSASKGNITTTTLASALKKQRKQEQRRSSSRDDVDIEKGPDNAPGASPRDPNEQQHQAGLQFRQPLFSLSWQKIKRKILLASTGTPSSGEGRSESSETSGASRQQMHRTYILGRNGNGETRQVHMDGDEEDWNVDQVVVDTEFWDEDGQPVHPGHNGHSSHGMTDRISNSGRDTTTAHSETAGSIIKSPTLKVIDGVFTFFVGYIIPKCQYFFEPRFGDPVREKNYQKESWYCVKRHAWFGSCFLILNWILILALTSQQSITEKVLYQGVFTLLTVPLPFMVAFDMPRKHKHIYSAWAAAACGCLGIFGLISMRLCRYLAGGQCGGNTYLLVSYYSTAFAVIALFAMKVNRFYVACAQMTYWILVCSLALPLQPTYARNAVNFLIYSIFIQYLHYSQEKIDRRMYTLRAQLKISYRAQQKAQIAEKKASNSKKRFISYIFHEVRVPLNTAYLAFQNLQAAGNFDSRDEEQMVEVYALDSSLQQVQQVLNDVLDLQRMDAGRFESSSQPFHFHRAINALNASLRVATTAKKQNLEISLDENIDRIPQSIPWQGTRATFVIGDEIRLRQVLTNLASNAVKFSREGDGTIKVTTKLIYPTVENNERAERESTDLVESNSAPQRIVTPGSSDASQRQWRTSITAAEVTDKGTPLSTAGTDKTFVSGLTQETDIEKHAGAATVYLPQSQDAQSHPYPPAINTSVRPVKNERSDSDESKDSSRHDKRDCIIVRIEISDTGPGIKPSDMVDLRLFSPYVQTEVGRVQGGKGSGLGLAIVRAIVQLAYGRLGVTSSKNGSTFWLEFRYPVALASEVQALQEPPTPMSITTKPPARPPIKPYKDGESSYSQWSASRFEAASSSGLPVTPSTVEKERAFSNHSPSPQTAAATTLSAKSSAGGNSRHASVSSGIGVPLVQTTSMDTHSPLTSEQWTSSNVIERSILPQMSVTSATPPSSSNSVPTMAQARMPTPSPPLAGSSSPVERPFPSPSEGTSASSAPPEGFTPISPIGEDAFTPATREHVLMPSPVTDVPPPQRTLQQQPSASHLPPLSESKKESLTVLVVDDDPMTRKLMSRMMTRLGCEVEEAENGQVFLDILLGTEGRPPKYFDIVTLDNAMPVLTGEQAIRTLRAAGRKDLIVGATGNALKSDQDSYINAGVDAVLLKPISIKDLKAMLALAQKRRDEAEENTPKHSDVESP